MMNFSLFVNNTKTTKGEKIQKNKKCYSNSLIISTINFAFCNFQKICFSFSSLQKQGNFHVIFFSENHLKKSDEYKNVIYNTKYHLRYRF